MRKVKIKDIKKEVKDVKKLSIRQIFDGIKVCVDNAESILSGSKILFENGKFGLSASLAVLSIEEIGKASWIHFIGFWPSNVSWVIFWKNLDQHDVKLGMAIQDIVGGRTLLDKKKFNPKKFEMICGEFKKIIPQYNKIKQGSIYVDFDKKKNRFISPEERENKGTAGKLIAYAEGAIKIKKLFIEEGFDNFSRTSEQIVVDHLKEIFKKSLIKTIKNIEEGKDSPEQRKIEIENLRRTIRRLSISPK